jgi:hypothetical protein
MCGKYVTTQRYSRGSFDWEGRRSKNVTHFAVLRTEKSSDAKKYTEESQHLEQE